MVEYDSLTVEDELAPFLAIRAECKSIMDRFKTSSKTGYRGKR
jgi:hypothetical protein